MRALRRKYLAPLILITAFAIALATQLAPRTSYAGSSLADCQPVPGQVCPFAGTNWD